MNKIPPLKAMQVFEATARHLSFSKAAQELCVTQSAVSHQIKLLENFMGKPMLIRHGRNISLTQQGDDFYSVIGDCFARISSVTNHLVTQESVTLKIVAQSSIAVDWLAPKIADFHQQQPNIATLLDMETQADRFDANEQDVIIGTWPTPDGFVTKKLRQEFWFPVCGEKLYQQLDANDPYCLLAHRLNTSENGEDWHLWLQHQQLRRPATLNFNYFTLALLASKASLAGNSISLSNEFIAGDAIKRGQLVAIKSLSYQLPWGHYFIHYRNNSHHNEAIKAFVDWTCKLSVNSD
jgi:LysR family glycine cleavage system transcriptional activator